jgi:hypothetical protein
MNRNGDNMWNKKQDQDEQQHLELKIDCDAMLLGLLGRKDLVETWWTGPNLHFGLQHPIDVFNSGAAGRQSVYSYLGEHCYGGGGY